MISGGHALALFFSYCSLLHTFSVLHLFMCFLDREPEKLFYPAMVKAPAHYVGRLCSGPTPILDIRNIWASALPLDIVTYHGCFGYYMSPIG